MIKSFVIEDDLQRQRLQQFIAGREFPFQIDFGPVRHQRSTTQNNRLWALHALASKATGYSPEEMHEYALCRHFGCTEAKVGGIIRQIPNKRSSTREKKEFGEFMEATEIWYASEFGVWLGESYERNMA